MNRLKELRQEKNIRQEDLAKAIGVSSMTISRWEKAEDLSAVKTEKAQQLADYFGVSVAYLLGHYEETFSFSLPSDDKEFSKETQRLIDAIDKTLEEDNSDYTKIKPQLEQTRDSLILFRSVREKSKKHFDNDLQTALYTQPKDIEFYQYLNYLLELPDKRIDAELLARCSLLDYEDKKFLLEMIKKMK
ncbi:helix-turn-helix domain-containing protein [Streptococcus hyointestinalis]|uniref:helix-turn-helix domain-containing protein n=1 Tax=Streptococcus hyointestinalis TaxID=1337 RepID=UPI003F99B2D4